MDSTVFDTQIAAAHDRMKAVEAPNNVPTSPLRVPECVQRETPRVTAQDVERMLRPGMPATRRRMKIRRKRLNQRIVLQRFMRPVMVQCRIKPPSASGKTMGRPRLLSDGDHAQNVTGALERRNQNHMRAALDAVELWGTMCDELAVFVRGLLVDLRWLTTHNDGERVRTRLAVEKRALDMFTSRSFWDELRHRLNCYMLKMTECYHKLMHAREYTQQQKVIAAALAAQALQTRQNILPELAEARRVYFKHHDVYESDDEEAAEHALGDDEDAGEECDSTVFQNARRNQRAAKRGKQIGSHGEARQDSMEILARTAVRRAGGNALRNAAQWLKIRRRKEATVRLELKQTTNPQRRQELERELRDVLRSGRLFQCKAARIMRMKQRREQEAQKQMQQGAFLQDCVDGGTSSAHARQHTCEGEAMREQERKREAELSRIRARAFPERTAPGLHIAGQCCEVLCTFLDHQDNMLGQFASTVRALVDSMAESRVLIDLLERRFAEADERSVSRWLLLETLLQRHVLYMLKQSKPLQRVVRTVVADIVDHFDDMHDVKDELQMWYNHGEGGLKTAYCARDNVAVQMHARKNAPPLGAMHQHSMIRGVPRIVNRDDETIPLPSSSFSASNVATHTRVRSEQRK